jgi:hypothetical protein
MIRAAAALLAMLPMLATAAPAMASDRYSKALRYVDQSGVERVAGQASPKHAGVAGLRLRGEGPTPFIAADQILVTRSVGAAHAPVRRAVPASRGTTIGPFTVQQPVRDPNPPAIRRLQRMEPTRISAFGLSWEAPIMHKGKAYPASCFPDCVPEEDR